MGIGFYDQIGDTFGETKAAVYFIIVSTVSINKSQGVIITIYENLQNFRRLLVPRRATVGAELYFYYSDPVVCMQYIDERPPSLPADQQLNSPCN